MSLKMPDHVVAQMHELAAEMGVRLHRAGEQAAQFIKPYAGPSAIVAKRETGPCEVVRLYSGAPGDPPKLLMQFEAEAILAFDPATLRKVLKGFGHSAADVERRVHQARIDAVARGQFIKPDVEAAPDRESIREVCEAFVVPLDAIDDEVREAAKRLDASIAQQRAQIAALEARAADNQRTFGALLLQLEGLMAPPPARRPGVKPAIAGLTRTVAEDHRLGRFKG